MKKYIYSAFLTLFFTFFFSSKVFAQTACPSGQNDPYRVCVGTTTSSGTVETCGSSVAGSGCGVDQCQTPADCAATLCPVNNPPPPTTYSTSGSIFVDTNKNGIKDTGESNYMGTSTITDNGINVAVTNGSYTSSGQGAGQHTIAYTSLPQGYTMTKPINGPPASYTVAVGTACDPDGSSGVCASGSLSSVDFGITNQNPWIQSSGSDIRIDSGINNNIPANASAQCGGPYMSLPGNGGQPGVIYSGNNNASFGGGQASSTNWVVSSPDGLAYRPPTPNTIRTSYNYLLANANQQGLTQADLTPQCSGGLTNCALNQNLPSGFYLSNGDLTLSGNYTFPQGKNFIILVHGNLRINGQIHVPQGSTAIFSTSGNITVDPSVGEASNTSSNPDIEGIFSSDQNFIIAGINSCSIGPDKRLNISGNVIANASYSAGSFINNRDLCLGNICPAIFISPRLDMVLNLPAIIKAPNYIWQEVAP